MAIDISGARKVHTRALEINTYEIEPYSTVVEGILKDDCFVTRYQIDGSRRPPGTIHHMILRMKLGGPELTIEEIEAEMPSVPHEECRQTTDALKMLVGMRIASGFTSNIKKILGGPKGCAHLISLLLAMAPSAVQGSWSAASQKPLDPSVYAERIMGFLTDTCRVWRKGGAVEQAYRQQLKGLMEDR